MSTQFDGPSGQNSNAAKKTDFKLGDLTIEESPQKGRAPTAFNYEIWKQAQKELNPQPSARYFFSSLLLHILVATGAIYYSLQYIHETQVETVEFEIYDPGMSLSPIAPLGPDADVSKDDIVSASVKTAPEAAAPTPVVPEVKAAPPKPAAPAPVQAAKPVPAPAPSTPKTTPTPAPIETYQAESPVVIPDSVDDIETPDVLNPQLQENTQAKADAEALRAQLEEAQREKEQTLLAATQDLNQESQAALAETDQLADQASDIAAQEEAEKIEAFNAARRARDAQAIAAARAAEASAARSARARGSQEQTGGGDGSGSAYPSGIRGLDQLRQKPGNPIPRYDEYERFNKHEGHVLYVAYVNKEGIPTNFRLIRSSGHSNLDAKTLAAISKWKFYPGQEGWVEFPFSWDLKGGPKEMPTRLRRVR